MKRKIGAVICFVAAVGVPLSLIAQQSRPLDSTLAQAEMYQRVHREVETYAQRIQVPPTFISYCWQELHLKTYAHPVNGHVPFGVDYNKIADQKQLDLIISVRENYERSYLILCLANAKKILSDAQ